ncbi:MAG: tetratricopeptide repeat protein [Promethearchaeota archaeon]
MEDYNNAIKAFNKAIKIDSNYRKAWNNLGLSFRLKKHNT